ncbi:uncharacterized protein PHALS_01516 [Plasmopara halstedii]|uniref:Uncharacterized protein n=1 Tax=Plasmopara halstedii TaxID=4781 RepID=A0A0P1ASW2_PLAHL|nr:uncharacterized protein PHALS_01516 [Plasmopara halstedii]CEG45201.1 hypothetical protein PHALS_01516 [Plasmopara halstedii]|eukprot:XP_024581570.1 hypothetical protein PHALS_01516 [Plasmopara halstedii]
MFRILRKCNHLETHRIMLVHTDFDDTVMHNREEPGSTVEICNAHLLAVLEGSCLKRLFKVGIEQAWLVPISMIRILHGVGVRHKRRVSGMRKKASRVPRLGFFSPESCRL